jgi:hypothetical protein
MSVCVWEPDFSSCDVDAWEAYEPDVQERALLLATEALLMLTYNRVGTCPITIRPCPKPARCGCDWNPHIRDGQWYNCRHTPCEPLVEIDLPGPVGFIDSMRIDGEEVDVHNGDWRLDDGHLLVWQGEGTSPVLTHQDLNKPDTATGTFSITYSRSHRYGKAGSMAVAALALEFAEGCKPKGKCKLPRGVRSVTRMGVSFTLEAGLFPNGLTGIDVTDQFIMKWVPAGSPIQNAVVFDPRKTLRPRVTAGVPARPGTGSL